MQIYFITGNTKKFEEATLVFQQSPVSKKYTLTQKELPLIEIQGTYEEISIKKAEDAFRLLQNPCLTDDVSVSFMTLHGFPGPYIRHMLEAIGEDGVWQLLKDSPNKDMHVTCTLSFKYDQEKPSILFSHTIVGSLVAPKGELKHGKASWNAIFQPKGFTKRYAEMTLEELSQISCRSHAIKKFTQYLNTNKSI